MCATMMKTVKTVNTVYLQYVFSIDLKWHSCFFLNLFTAKYINNKDNVRQQFWKVLSCIVMYVLHHDPGKMYTQYQDE